MRRRTLGILTAAVVTVALVAASLTLPKLFDSSPVANNPRQHTELWRLSFAMDDIPGHQVAFSGRTRDAQMAAVYLVDDGYSTLGITMFSAGVYDPTVAKAGEPVDVNGMPGFFRTDMPCGCGNGVEPRIGLVFRYAPNSWTLVSGVTSSKLPDLLRVAKAIRFDRTTPLRLPFRVAYLPSGTQPKQDAPGYMGLNTTAVMLDGRYAFEITTADRTVNGHDSDHEHPVGEPFVPAGRSYRIPGGGDATMRTVNLGEFSVDVVSSDERIPVAELEKIARSIAPAAELKNKATWFDADKVMPLS